MSELSKQYFVQISERSMWRVIKFLGFTLLLAVVVVGLVYLKDLMLPIVISIFLSYLLEPAVDAMENHGMNRTIAVSVLFVAIIGAIVLMVMMLSDTVSDEMQHMLSGANTMNPQKLIDQFRANLEASFPSLAKTNIFANLAEQASTYAKGFLSTSVESATHMVGALGHMIIIPFIVFFFLKESRELKKLIVESLPNRWFEMALSLIHKISLQLGRFIRGQLMDSAIVGTMITIALLILDVRYAIFIGILAGLANMIPYLGPVVGGIPAILVSVMDKGDFSAVPSIILAFAVIKIIDDVLVQPIVVSKSVELHPVVVILAIIAGGNLGGIFGMIIAVPLTSIIKVTVSILHWGFTKYYIFSPPSFAGDKPVAVVPLARTIGPPRRVNGGEPLQLGAGPRRKGKRRR
jgi:predicted PurR-regulated permease PerM